MSQFTFLSPLYGFTLLGCLAIAGLIATMEWRRRKNLLDFCEEGSRPWHEERLHTKSRWTAYGFALFSTLCCALALMRPAWNPQPTPMSNQGRDVIFILDVSRSMLARDAYPNRLAMAKDALRSALNVDPGDRFGLLLFAGSSSIKSPLTQDKDFILEMIDKADDSSVYQGGTLMEDALLKALNKLVLAKTSQACDFILLSDGEDLGPTPTKAIDKINELGCRLIVVGIGDRQFGARIPDRDGQRYVTFQGQEVWSRQNEQSLSSLAKAVRQGVYYNAGQSHFDLGHILAQLRLLWPGTARMEEERIVWTEAYLYFLILAAIFSTCAILANLNFTKMLAKFFGVGLIFCFPNDVQAVEALLSASEVAPQSMSNLLSETTSDNMEASTQPSLTEQQLKLQSDLQQQLVLEPHSSRLLFRLGQFNFSANCFEAAIENFKLAADYSSEGKVVLTCRFNEALSWIYLSEYNAILLEDLDIESMLDEDELALPLAPEECLRQAIQLFQNILSYDPRQPKAARHLEWCKKILNSQQNNSNQQNPPQDPNQQEQQNSEQKDESSDSPSEEENKSDQSSDKSSDSAENASSQEQAFQTEQISLPPPSLSPEDILQQRERDSLKRKQGSPNKKKTTVEKDW
jgi:Ca-activated chloride channel homolog